MQKEMKMTYLLKIRISSWQSIVDFFQTRLLQLKLYHQRVLWKKKVIDTPPADEIDFTSMLDAAERQNNLRRILK